MENKKVINKFTKFAKECKLEEPSMQKCILLKVNSNNSPNYGLLYVNEKSYCDDLYFITICGEKSVPDYICADIGYANYQRLLNKELKLPAGVEILFDLLEEQ